MGSATFKENMMKLETLLKQREIKCAAYDSATSDKDRNKINKQLFALKIKIEAARKV
jgi:hypothetical protein